MLAPGMSFYRVTRVERLFSNSSLGESESWIIFVPLKACLRVVRQ